MSDFWHCRQLAFSIGTTGSACQKVVVGGTRTECTSHLPPVSEIHNQCKPFDFRLGFRQDLGRVQGLGTRKAPEPPQFA